MPAIRASTTAYGTPMMVRPTQDTNPDDDAEQQLAADPAAKSDEDSPGDSGRLLVAVGRQERQQVAADAGAVGGDVERHQQDHQDVQQSAEEREDVLEDQQCLREDAEQPGDQAAQLAGDVEVGDHLAAAGDEVQDLVDAVHDARGVDRHAVDEILDLDDDDLDDQAAGDGDQRGSCHVDDEDDEAARRRPPALSASSRAVSRSTSGFMPAARMTASSSRTITEVIWPTNQIRIRTPMVNRMARLTTRQAAASLTRSPRSEQAEV